MADDNSKLKVVYVIVEPFGDDVFMDVVFSTEEKAQEWIKANDHSHLRIRACELDNTRLPK